VSHDRAPSPSKDEKSDQPDTVDFHVGSMAAKHQRVKGSDTAGGRWSIVDVMRGTVERVRGDARRPAAEGA
jgi:hypothetical protein